MFLFYDKNIRNLTRIVNMKRDCKWRVFSSGREISDVSKFFWVLRFDN